MCHDSASSRIANSSPSPQLIGPDEVKTEPNHGVFCPPDPRPAVAAAFLELDESLAVVYPHFLGKRLASRCRQEFEHPRQKAGILRRLVVYSADGGCNQIELHISREVLGQSRFMPHATEACSHKTVHICRRLELLVGIAMSRCDGDLALLGEDSADRGSNVPGEARLRS